MLTSSVSFLLLILRKQKRQKFVAEAIADMKKGGDQKRLSARIDSPSQLQSSKYLEAVLVCTADEFR
jgi:hypothetical protein